MLYASVCVCVHVTRTWYSSHQILSRHQSFFYWICVKYTVDYRSVHPFVRSLDHCSEMHLIKRSHVAFLLFYLPEYTRKPHWVDNFIIYQCVLHVEFHGLHNQRLQTVLSRVMIEITSPVLFKWPAWLSRVLLFCLIGLCANRKSCLQTVLLKCYLNFRSVSTGFAIRELWK